METTTIPDYPRGVTSEQVWVDLQETKQIVKDIAEQQKETDRLMKEAALRHTLRQEETDQQMKEYREQQKESEQQWKEEQKEFERQWNKLMGKWGNRFGEILEHLVRPSLLQRFSELGFDFDLIRPGPYRALGENRVLTEVDAFLENNKEAMIVEIKSKPSIDDIKEHIERMDRIRVWADNKNDKRKFLGAIAGMVINDNERNFALKSGFYVIEPSGETFTVTAPEGSYSPREW